MIMYLALLLGVMSGCDGTDSAKPGWSIVYTTETSSDDGMIEDKISFSNSLAYLKRVYYQIPDSAVLVLKDGIEGENGTFAEWTLIWNYPHIINSIDELKLLTDGKLDFDFDKYSLIAIGTSFESSSCSYKLNVKYSSNVCNVEFTIYEPDLTTADILSGVILLQIPKMHNEKNVVFKVVKYKEVV